MRAWEIKVKPLPGKHVEGLPRRLPVVEINGIPTDDYERINEVLRAQSRRRHRDAGRYARGC